MAAKKPTSKAPEKAPLTLTQHERQLLRVRASDAAGDLKQLIVGLDDLLWAGSIDDHGFNSEACFALTRISHEMKEHVETVQAWLEESREAPESAGGAA